MELPPKIFSEGKVLHYSDEDRESIEWLVKIGQTVDEIIDYLKERDTLLLNKAWEVEALDRRLEKLEKTTHSVRTEPRYSVEELRKEIEDYITTYYPDHPMQEFLRGFAAHLTPRS